VEIFRAWGEKLGAGEKGAGQRLDKALSQLDRTRAADAHERFAKALLWRTFLGRTAALRALHRDWEALEEAPSAQSNGDECPEDMRAKCKEHLGWLLATFPGAFRSSKKGDSTIDNPGGVWRYAAAMVDPRDLFKLPQIVEQDKTKSPLVLHMSSEAVTMEGGKRVLRAKVDDVQFHSGTDCKTYLKTQNGAVEVKDGKVATEERCATNSVDTVKGKTLVVKLPADAPRPRGYETVSVVVDVSSLKKSADGRTYTFERAYPLEIASAYGKRYAMHVDLTAYLKADELDIVKK
jgi:hypothetical protein